MKFLNIWFGFFCYLMVLPALLVTRNFAINHWGWFDVFQLMGCVGMFFVADFIVAIDKIKGAKNGL